MIEQDGVCLTPNPWERSRAASLSEDWFRELESRGVVPNGSTPNERKVSRKLAAWKPQVRKNTITPFAALGLSAAALRRALKKKHAKINDDGYIVDTRSHLNTPVARFVSR